MRLQLITFALAAVVLNSCGTTKSTDSTLGTNSTGPMLNTDSPSMKIPTEIFWKLESLDGKDFSKFQNNGNDVGFTLFADNNRVTGYAGCNNFFGTYKIEPGNRIAFSEVGATKMMCETPDFDENDFLKVFQSADSYRLKENKLEIMAAGAPVAVFINSAIPLEPIVEKYWKLKTLEGKRVKMGENQEGEVFFTLKNDDKRVTGFAGCNNISGTYSLEKGNRIRFSQMATTMKACPDMDFNESEFLKIFEIADSYRITGDRLELYVGRRAPLAVFEAVYMK